MLLSSRPTHRHNGCFAKGRRSRPPPVPLCPAPGMKSRCRPSTSHARVDILEPTSDRSHALIEVKGSNDIKPEHLWDVAFQRHVAESAGAQVSQSELMYLNRDCRHPELGALFIRTDVSTEIDPLVREVPARVTELLDVLRGPLPGDSRNANCGECPFYDRCWPQDPFAVNRFYRMKWSEKLALERSGTMEFTNVPKATRLTSIQRRQQEAAHIGDMVIDSALGSALDEWSHPLVYLDFETVAFAIPRFAGTTPWTKIPVQYSAHREDGVGAPACPFSCRGERRPSSCPGRGPGGALRRRRVRRHLSLELREELHQGIGRDRP